MSNDLNEIVVANHFNQKNHNVKRDFSFTVIMSNLTDSRLRFGFENEFIHFFKSQHRIMNCNIPTLSTKSYYRLFSNSIMS